MIKVVPFEPEHMVNIDKSDVNSKVLEFLDDLDYRAECYAKAGPAITMLLGDTVLAIGGVLRLWPGVGEAWMMVAPEGRQRGVALYKTMKVFLDNCEGFHRIQTSVLYGHSVAHRCIMQLGFIPEGMMVHYGPNKENYVRYVRF